MKFPLTSRLSLLCALLCANGPVARAQISRFHHLPITERPTQAQIDAVVAEVDALEPVPTRPEDVDRKHLRRVRKGYFPEAHTWYVDADRYAQQANIRVEASLERVRQRLPLEHWSANQPNYQAGGRETIAPGVQLSRMLIEEPTRLDLTRIEIVRPYVDAQGRTQEVRLYWKTYHSQNHSLSTDLGSLSLRRVDESNTSIEFRSDLRLGESPEFFLVVLTNADLRRIVAEHIATHYQGALERLADIGHGRRTALTVPEPVVANGLIRKLDRLLPGGK